MRAPSLNTGPGIANPSIVLTASISGVRRFNVISYSLFPTSRDVDFSRNLFYGSLPGTLPAKLTYLSVEGNLLSGSIPANLSSANSLSTLVFRDNYLSGSIPAELANLSTLRYVSETVIVLLTVRVSIWSALT